MIERGQAILDVLKREGISAQPEIHGAEVGVWNGELSECLLRELPTLFLRMVDWWRPTPPQLAASRLQPGSASPIELHLHRKARAMDRTEFAAARRIIWHMSSVRAARQVTPGRLDFAYIDAGHTLREVLSDLRAWSRCVRRGGILCGHDIDHPHDAELGTDEWAVRPAVERWIRENGIASGIETGPDTTWFVRMP